MAEVLRRWGVAESRVHDAQLLTTELVTNALIHARSASTVTVVREAVDSVRIEVADRSSAMPIPRAWGPEAATGRGLHIVDRLSAAWGVRPDASGEGKVVWFELDVGRPVDGGRRDEASDEKIG